MYWYLLRHKKAPSKISQVEVPSSSYQAAAPNVKFPSKAQAPKRKETTAPKLQFPSEALNLRSSSERSQAQVIKHAIPNESFQAKDSENSQARVPERLLPSGSRRCEGCQLDIAKRSSQTKDPQRMFSSEWLQTDVSKRRVKNESRMESSRHRILKWMSPRG